MDEIKDIILPGLFGFLGGLVSMADSVKRGAKFSILTFCADCVSSSIVGITCYWFALGEGLNESLCACSCALGGMVGTRIIDYIDTWVRNRLG